MTFEEQLSRWFHDDGSAVHFAMAIWTVAQDWDDVWDETGNIDRTKIDDLLAWLAFTKESHPFYVEHGDILRPAMLQMWLQWQAANALEEGVPTDEDLARSFMLRAGFYGLVHTIAFIIGGTAWAREIAPEIYRAYGETLDGLKLEMADRNHLTEVQH